MSKDQKETRVESLTKPTATEKSDRQNETTQIQKTLAPEKSPSKSIEQESSPTLQKWADLITNDIDNPHQSPTIKISRFGLKTSKDVVAFLRSPAGDSVMAEIGAHLAAEKSLDDYQQLQLREKQLMMNRLKAAFFLWYIERKAHAAHQQREIIIAQNERAIKNSGQTAQPTTLRPSTERTSLMRSIADYDQAIRSYQNRHAQLQDEREVLDKRLSKLDDQMHMIDYKYNLYDMQLKDFDSSLEKLENAPTPEQVVELKTKVNLIETEINEIQTEVAKLTQLNRHDEVATLMKKQAALGLERDNYLEILSTEAVIQSQIDSIKTKMDEILIQVDELIQSNQDDEAAVLMKTHTSLNLNLGRHYDMLAVRNGEKQYVTEDGKTELNGKPVSFKDAHFVLKKGQQIIKDGDEHYLLQPGQTWDLVKDNKEALKIAKDSFIKAKPELLVVENVAKLNKGLESTFTKEQITDVHTKIDNIVAEQTLIKNQTGLIQAAKASAQNLLDNPNLGLTAPTPTITQGNSIPVPKPSQASSTLFYKNKLEEFRNSQSVSQKDLMDLVTQAPGINRQAATAYLQTEFGKTIYKNMVRTAPIPHVMMQSLLQNLERFGVDATKPSVTAIKNPLEKIEQNDSRPQLTPLSTNPFK